MKNKSVLFLVQGEGRGHLTQAITINEMLRQQGFELCCVVVGAGKGKSVPAFFQTAISAPVFTVPSPCFITDNKNQHIRLGKTVLHNLLRIGDYIDSVNKIRKLINFHQPAFIINFYEPLGALFNLFYGYKLKTVSIAHQFIYLHPAFSFPGSNRLKKTILRIYTRFVAMHSHQILAISMYDLPTADHSQVRVIPPLLRNSILQMKPGNKNFILVYLVNSGYHEQILQWHAQHPDINIHCFMDCSKVRVEKNGEWKVDETLTFHALNDRKFMDMMANCDAMATTAGFESICEAMYLSKPVMMVPVEGQFEQFCNAADAQKNGAGIHADHFDLSQLVQYIPNHKSNMPEYKNWVSKAQELLMQAIATV